MFNPKVLNSNTNKPATPSRFGSNPMFMKTFKSMLNKQGGSMKRNPKGVDRARGLGQAKASVAGRNNTKRTPMMSSVDPVAAAMQHSVRNRSQEQGGNASSSIPSAANGRTAQSSVFKFVGGA